MLIKKGWKKSDNIDPFNCDWMPGIPSFINFSLQHKRGGLKKKKNRYESIDSIPETQMSMPVGKLFYFDPII